MAQNKVMKLWTAIVTAFLALCTALGLVTATTATATAAPKAESPEVGEPHPMAPTILAMHHWAWSHTRALPPTMKQRIRAEAHGKSPNCRHHPLTDTEAQTETSATGQDPAALDC
ncbi:hypothetical protein LK07_16800 [Streptomyces pluripotens]|uniref:Secreted protein n=1 Tax=Streptomyces pluripotens TaxID=1355015 RepID=A0A221P0X6_9ACTN|nr:MULTISPECIES: DUF6344 domain-containing protein [Streptomyces]ARP71164.1 hypothetical protein LK06_015655 [Streptomyces pluripotens]ASN25415.1 hypothetical protein LK07_16800 [Streptomyces pluripotens]KIE26044.1 hypothetical protein LK08_16665 [Streptomyces sp. MUSC 125]MCH0557054.1 hypothetical protein [Streptomyces sp. MUM 16J]